MKIGILTFHCAVNYGALLQTYALQEYIKSLGHEVYVIDYRPKYLTIPYRSLLGYQYHGESICTQLRLKIRELSIAPIRWTRKYKFLKFTRKYINLARFDFNRIENDFDAFIFGSDQIWNPYITDGFDNIYFGKFIAAINKRLITYAASAGSVENIMQHQKIFFNLLNNYTSISVREKCLEEFIREKQPNVEVKTVIDPVLLSSTHIFKKIALKRKIKKPYMLIFSLALTNIEELRFHAKHIAEQRNLQIVELISMSESMLNNKQLKTESPESFISLFQYADYVVTSSFHGTVFSILFCKNFNTIFFNSTISERMLEMLTMLNLSNRLIMHNKNFCIEDIDYDKVNPILTLLRKESQKYIKTALS